MKLITEMSVADFVPSTERGKEVVEKIVKCGKVQELDQILDLLWAPDGFTQQQWDEFLDKEHDHILARFVP